MTDSSPLLNIMDPASTAATDIGPSGAATSELSADTIVSSVEPTTNSFNPNTTTGIGHSIPTTLTAENIGTPDQLAALKRRHAELKDELETALCEERGARVRRAAQPGFDMIKDILASDEHDKCSMDIMKQIRQMKLPTPQPLESPLTELSVDFKIAHDKGDNKLDKFDVVPGREWYNDDGDLVTRLQVYILMRFGASKSVNEDGIPKYMSLESVHNLWIMCRHLINHYESLERYEKGQATQSFTALTQRLIHKYKLSSGNMLALPGISALPPWTDYWYNFLKDLTLRDLCQFDLSTDINGGESQTAGVSDGILVVHASLQTGAYTTREPHNYASSSTDTA